jgi:hypothetical protein
MSDSALRNGRSEKRATSLLRINLSTFGRRGSAAVALITYTGLAVAMFSSTWVHPTTWSIGLTGDPQQFMWFLGWPPFAVTHGHNPIFTDYIIYPNGVNLMWNASELLPALVLGPLTHLGGSVLSYNVLMTMAVALSSWTGYLLIRRYVSSQLAAGVGGALYGFSPFMTAHSLGHPHVTVAFMPPVLLILLDELVRVQRHRPIVSGLLLGLAGAAQLFIGEELLVTGAGVGFVLLCLAIAMRGDQIRSRYKHALVGFATAAVVFVALTAVPLGFQLFGPQHMRGLLQPPNTFVSDAWSFFVPTKLFLVAPKSATTLADTFSGGDIGANAYVGVLLFPLLAITAVRYWSRLEVRLAALGAALIAILSMGITIHYAGRVSSIPVFALGLVFPLLQRYLPGRLMLYLTFFGWFSLSQLPVFRNILPDRLMLYFYLLAGLLIAVWLSDLRAWQPRARWLGRLAVAASLVLLLPALPFPSTPDPVPAFFAGGAASRIPAGSVAVVVPFSVGADGRAMLWQQQSGMRFRMPEGYAFNPNRGSQAGPPSSATQTQVIAVAEGRSSSLTDETRLQIRSELRSWHVQTVIIGPMDYEQQEVDLFTSLFGQAPQTVDGVYVWWGVDALL